MPPHRQLFMDMGRVYALDPRVKLSIEDRGDGPMLVHTTPLPGSNGYVISWAAEWARLAFPIIQPTHSYAAALMATVAPDLDIQPPWPIFYLAVPDGLISLLGTRKEPEAVNGMLVFVEKDRWTWVATATTVEFSKVNYPLSLMREQESTEEEPPAWGESTPQLTAEAHDERAALCLTRLLLNACLAMSDPTAVRQVGKAHGWRAGQSLPATPRVFEIGRPVRLDCRQSVRDFIRGGSRLPSVQWLVRGHWRNQAYGPGHQQRRLQWIEPFWKGADGAPLQVREHLLDEHAKRK